MLINTRNLSMHNTVEDVIEQMLPIIKQLLTPSEREQIKVTDPTITTDEVVNRYIKFYAVQAVKACLNYSGIVGSDASFDYVAINYPPICDLTVVYIRESLTSRSLTENGNGSIKSISSSGRSVTFMGLSEVGGKGIPQSILDRLPKPKAKVKVW